MRSSAFTIAEWSPLGGRRWRLHELNNSCAGRPCWAARHRARGAPARARLRSFWCSSMRKAGIESALDHALAVHFEYGAKPQKAAHQRLAHLGRGRRLPWMQTPALRSPPRCLSATMIWLHNLAGLAVAVAADQRDVLAHQLEHRLDLFECRLRSAYHDRQRRVFLAPTSPPDTGASRYSQPEDR